MIQKINSTISLQRNGLIDSEDIYIVDYKKHNKGKVEVLTIQPEIAYVHLSNHNKVELHYVAFEENALKVNRPEGQVEQCECVLFPSTFNEEDWMLFVEAKYTSTLEIAMNERIDYPNKMISQIISTVGYFRENQIISSGKKVQAIVSFPPLIEEFSEAFFTRSSMTQEEIAINHRILIRPSNRGLIKSEKRIKI